MLIPSEPEFGNGRWPLRLIGRDTIVELDERLYIVLGFDPMSVRPVTAHLQDLHTGEEQSAALDEIVTPRPPVAADRVVSRVPVVGPCPEA
jgi:hypothetical protein